MNTSSFRQPARLRTLGMAVAVALGGATLMGCTHTRHTTPEGRAGVPSNAATLNSQANDALQRLYHNVPGSRELIAKSAGVLVFPSVVGGSFGVGAEYGRGVLLVKGQPQGYYNSIAGSLGFQAGAQSRALIYVFNTEAALQQFRASQGWTVGADATVAFATVGANAELDSRTLTQPVVGFALTNAGLEAGVAVQGTKISPIRLN